MSDNYFFYDAHPGFGGAVKPLPVLLKNSLSQFENKICSIEDVIQKLTQIGSSLDINIHRSENMILAKLKSKSDGTIHAWRLLRFK